eukprot:gnl/MRDRNA2_/MRDRNA2_36453_c0_seq1.p1 gnl/MRDRNA2_/MRDRNA2_36453_c0~~gnl/MRDRNA2_/MRDRNA2_36453_c0_seq1.p1  ORF type:complete len:307 (-),score=55.10 gnl/MRDRNA2_/MRDRNA2_36453_c0_seq1:130-1050(-)
MAQTLWQVILVCCVLSVDSSRLMRQATKHETGAESPGVAAFWDENWSSTPIQHLRGKAQTKLKTFVDATDEDWTPVFPVSAAVPAEQTTVLQMLGTRHSLDWTGLVLQGRVFWKNDSDEKILIMQWRDEYTHGKCDKVFAGHEPDTHNERYLKHCDAITGHGKNHGIGGAMEDIIRLGLVHVALRTERRPGKMMERHWFGVLTYTEEQRESWLSKNKLCQISGPHVLILPLESSESELKAYEAGIHENKWAFPESLNHEEEDGIVHNDSDKLPNHSMVGRLVFRYECHASDSWRPRVKEISLLIQD